MEEVYAEFLLWFHGFHANERYEALLHQTFLNLIDDILLDLEECSSHALDTRGRFMRYWDYECSVFNPDRFGKALMDGLKAAYKANTFCIEEFGRRCRRLCWDIPFDLQGTEPFLTLSYADECLSWDDEEQTRSLYESAFAFYDS